MSEEVIAVEQIAQLILVPRRRNVLPGADLALLYAFTEQGVALLLSVLRSERAVKVSIAIMRSAVR